MTRTYSEMILLPTFEDRFEYLKLYGIVGESTFGFDRYLNQRFYTSREWRSARSKCIVRDDGCDLAIPERQIFDRIYIHHINPITLDDLENMSPLLFDLNNLVCVSYDTHLGIHYGNDDLITNISFDRKPGDTKLW